MKTFLPILILLSGIFILVGCNKDEETYKGVYSLRDIGPAGGYIFYINPNFKSDGWRYLEAAPSDQGSKPWGSFNSAVSGADGKAVGTGAQNTIDIVASDPSNNTAAYVCANYSLIKDGVTFDDWFLPSRDELELMCINLRLVGVGNFPTNSLGNYLTYWSSSEGGVKIAWGKCFQTELQTAGPKENPYAIRPVRAFQEPGFK